jgi:glycosyltransferase involved in cell wall biosynthesis
MTQAEFVVNGRFLQRPVTGVERVSLELVRALTLRAATKGTGPLGFRFLLPSGPGGDDLPHIERRFSPPWLPRGHLWEQLVLPFTSPGAPLINLANAAPVLRRRQCVLVHDAAVYDIPASFTAAYRLWYRTLYAALQRTGALVCTVSAFSKERLEHHLPRLAGRIAVISPGVDHVWRIAPAPDALERLGLERRGFVLAVGSAAQHKNQELVLRTAEAIGKLGLKVALVGGSRHKVFRAGAASAAGNVVRLGYVDDRTLRALYEAAFAFVFPSLYEGFGLPPLEAMALRCPTIVSRVRPLTDNCRDGALQVDPDDPAELVQALASLRDAERRRQLADRGRARAARFIWDTAAQQLMSLVSDAAGRTVARSLPTWVEQGRT